MVVANNGGKLNNTISFGEETACVVRELQCTIVLIYFYINEQGTESNYRGQCNRKLVKIRFKWEGPSPIT